MMTARVSTRSYSASTSTMRPDESATTCTGSPILMSASDADSQSPPIARCRIFAPGGTVITTEPEGAAIVNTAPDGLTAIELSAPATGTAGCGDDVTVANDNTAAIVA